MATILIGSGRAIVDATGCAVKRRTARQRHPSQLVDDPNLLARAQAGFNERTDGFAYKAAIPDGAVPPKPHI